MTKIISKKKKAELKKYHALRYKLLKADKVEKSQDEKDDMYDENVIKLMLDCEKNAEELESPMTMDDFLEDFKKDMKDVRKRNEMLFK